MRKTPSVSLALYSLFEAYPKFSNNRQALEQHNFLVSLTTLLTPKRKDIYNGKHC
jgi:hypothetical protein